MKQNDDEEESTIKLLVDNNCSNDPFINIITDNVLYYISGYIVKKLIPVLQCPYDIKALFDTSNNTNFHDYCQQNKKAFNNLTNVKSRGGLQLASESILKIVKQTEQYFKCIAIDKRQLFIKNMDQKIMIMVQNSLALCTNILPETNTCFEDTDMHSRPHKINIINLVSRMYLNIRIHSYSKILSSSIMKTSVNKRQKLHKSILFNNL
ncbi:unnamed protein product [Macrosiphum euphorbiae]|uniref:Uncharacterized protein n=1 Tax=Macrosiphum euphorbiae TaxID=13131 RepID=A0AAV0WKA2_9HEMI|nr:unnamed protein product [Macrosiphum euphorbiae]